MSNARLRWSLACLAAAAVAACKGKDPAPPPPTQPPATAAPATTTTTTTTTTVPTPPPIWREARWGMSAAQVLAAFPAEAQRLPQAVNFGPQIPGASDVAIPAYELDSVRYRVLFGFEADALNRVHLSAPKAAETTCGDLEKAITEKHAEPADRSSTMTNLRNDVVVWKRPDQTITLTCSEARGLGYRQVMLDYAAPAGEAVSAR
jgi:hypothetical protein